VNIVGNDGPYLEVMIEKSRPCWVLDGFDMAGVSGIEISVAIKGQRRGNQVIKIFS
jgi:hypothetical protein